ncbi:hypothetical protein [Rhizobium leguminosarum]|uniref:hypothetical protein n=1 Tax=Rhizobium leguminosarum TaxID=384 RepID=UPI0014415B3C|nr:hypothetical protein [Rhizobium leguminosarum]MBY5866455.1 hypothetical protein [Rhizobium leguminosarum]NKM05571.1 hypothetical protein [Rhizobium leguminosarum bv. viciae]
MANTVMLAAAAPGAALVDQDNAVRLQGFSKPWTPSLSSFSCRHIAYSGISVGSRSWLQGEGFIDLEAQESRKTTCRGSIRYPA